MPPIVLDAAQLAQTERAYVVGYLRGRLRALVVCGAVTSVVERALRTAGFVRVAPNVHVWRPS